MSECNRVIHTLLLFLKDKKERRPESVVICLSVQIIIRNKDLHGKCAKLVLPALATLAVPDLRSFHHRHKIIPRV